MQLPNYKEDKRIKRVAEYSHIDGMIRINPTRFYALDKLMQMFVLLHEEAHALRVPNPDFKRDEGLEIECDIEAAVKLWKAGFTPAEIVWTIEASDILTAERKEAVRGVFVSGFTERRKEAVWAEIYNVFGGKEGYDTLARDIQKAIEGQVKILDNKFGSSIFWGIEKLKRAAADIAMPYAQAKQQGMEENIDLDAIAADFDARKESSAVQYVVLGLAVVAVLVVTFFVLKKKGVV